MAETEKKSSWRRRRRKRPWRWWKTLFLLALVVGGALYYYERQGRISVEEAARNALAGTVPKTEEVQLFFGDPKWTRLVAETRQVREVEEPAARIRLLVETLIRGPREGGAVLPSDVVLKRVYIGADGLAVLDFSASFAPLRAQGAAAELLAVYAVVNTVTQNVEGVRSVLFLVEGKRVESLGGNVDVSEPVLPRPDLYEPQTR
jgi:spore germination protein GerM